MRYYIPKDIEITDSSIPAHTDEAGTVYPQWNKTSEWKENDIVSHNGSLFKAFTNIYPLATYLWNDIAENVTAEVIKLDDNTSITPTAVPCTQDVTIVYVKDTHKTGGDAVIGKYFKYTGVTGNVDFTTIDPASPSNFTEISNYRYDAQEPQADTDSIYWEYLGRTNRNKIIDKSNTSQSSVALTTEVWWETEVLNPDRVTLFNIQAPSARIIIYTDDILNPLYDNTKDSLLDTSPIVNWRTLSRFNQIYTNNVSWKIPFITGTVKVRVILFSATTATIKAGELLIGELQDLAMTLDNVPMQIKSSSNVVEKSNGDIILEDEGDVTKIFLIYDFSILYDTETHDVIVDRCIELINRRIVIEAENTDDAKYRSLIFYGFVRNASPTLVTNSTKSKIQIQAQRFK